MKAKRTIQIAATVVAVAGVFAYLVFSSMGDTMVYYKTVEELLQERDAFQDRVVRANGLLVDGSIEQKPGTDEFRFVLSKNSKTLQVTYNGILPDTMAPGRELVVEGVLTGTGNNFKASEILTKCPSKYEETAQKKGGQ